MSSLAREVSFLPSSDADRAAPYVDALTNTTDVAFASPWIRRMAELLSNASEVSLFCSSMMIVAEHYSIG